MGKMAFFGVPMGVSVGRLYHRIARPDNRLSIARGVAVYSSETDLVFANVFKRADDAMYKNKAAIKATDGYGEN